MVLQLCMAVLHVTSVIATPLGAKDVQIDTEVTTHRSEGRTFVPGVGESFTTAPTHCEFDDGSKGFCVQTYLCSDGNVVEDGRSLITERKYGCQSPQVCCRHDKASVIQPTPPTTDKKRDKSIKATTLIPPTVVEHIKPTRCEFEDGRAGYCVQQSLCRNGKINQDGAGEITERHLQCWKPEVCCELDHEGLMQNESRTLVPPIRERNHGESCEAFDGSTGRCVLVHLCNNSTSIVDGSGFITERQSDPCSVWAGAILICCPAKYLVGKIIPNDTDTSTGIITKNNDKDATCVAKDHSQGVCVLHYQCNDEYEFDGSGVINDRYNANCAAHQVCCSKGKVNKTKEPTVPLASKPCGTVNEDGVWPGLKVTPLEAKFGEFPWMVAVRTKSSRFPENYNTTGGSLIHPSVVLTVAHYVARAVDNDILVRAGEWNILDVDEILPHQEVGVKTVVIHPDFNKSNYRNDIALLFLKTPIKLLPHLGVACLPTPNEVVAPSTDCVANGWGKDRHGNKGVISNVLKKITVPAVDHEDCQNRLRTTRLGIFFQLHEGFICAGGERLDTCALDGGSPLTCPSETDQKRHIQYGVVAWGIDCHVEKIPGVYMNVAHYRYWIDNHVKAEGLDTSVYTYK